MDVETHFKQPKGPKAKGRARPEEPLATVCESGFCGRPATERHHILRRSQGGSDDKSNTIDFCSGCHLWCHENPAESYDMGWLKRRAG